MFSKCFHFSTTPTSHSSHVETLCATSYHATRPTLHACWSLLSSNTKQGTLKAESFGETGLRSIPTNQRAKSLQGVLVLVQRPRTWRGAWTQLRERRKSLDGRLGRLSKHKALLHSLSHRKNGTEPRSIWTRIQKYQLVRRFVRPHTTPSALCSPCLSRLNNHRLHAVRSVSPSAIHHLCHSLLRIPTLLRINPILTHHIPLQTPAGGHFLCPSRTRLPRPQRFAHGTVLSATLIWRNCAETGRKVLQIRRRHIGQIM